MKQENTSGKILKTIFPLHSFIYENVIKSQAVSETILEGGNIVKIQAELNKKRAEAEMNELNAKVLQELAIAHRIENAVDVEIEEYYENGGGGKVTGNMNENNPVVEISGDSKKVTRRVYKFKGLRND